MKKIEHLKYIIVIVNIIFIIRLFFICILSHDYYKNLYNDLEKKTYKTESPPRGRILDRNGKILVDNEGIRVLVFKGNRYLDDDRLHEIIDKVSEVIALDIKVSEDEKREYFYSLNSSVIDERVSEDDIKRFDRREITADEYKDIKYSLITLDELDSIDDEKVYIYKMMTSGYLSQDKIIKSGITDKELTDINELGIEELGITLRWVRKYNYDTTLNNLFGNIGSIPKEDINTYLDKGYDISDFVGVSFLEKYYEDYLRGEKGEYIIEDGKKIIIKEEKRGSDVILAIDIDIQMGIEKMVKEEIIKAKKYPSSKYYNGSYVIVSDPNDGSIISFVALKYNDGNITSDTIGLLTNSYTVGSVVKGASHTVAYNYGVLNEKTRMFDACVKLYSQREKCSWKKLGYINDIDALAYSSNYFQFINAIRVSGYKYKRNMKFNPTEDDFNKYRIIFKSYGLGVKSGIDLYEEQLGITGDNYSGDLLLNLSIGQYDTYTPLMLNSYISTIANRGIRYRIHLAKGIIDTSGKYTIINNKEVLNKVDIEPKYMDRIRQGFHNVVLKGTAMSYFNYKYDGAGKTGTSETYYNGVSTYTNTFVGFVPFDNPEYAITIVSPNIAISSMNNYKYPINSRISKAINKILFEK